LEQDLFGHKGQAQAYSVYRPKYNEEIFRKIDDYLGIELTERSLAVDVGTGTGQVAVPLSTKLDFKRVIGVDRSEEQLKHAVQADGVDYCVGDAYNLPLDPDSAGVLTIAQAMHWLDLTVFFQEVQRVLKPGGTFIVLGYAIPRISQQKIEREFRRYYEDTLGSLLPPESPGSYWDCDRVILDSGFESVNFNVSFKNVVREWVYDIQDVKLDAHISYLQTMSAYRTYLSHHQLEVGDPSDPLVDFETRARKLLTEDGTDTVSVTYPYFLIMAQKI